MALIRQLRLRAQFAADRLRKLTRVVAANFRDWLPILLDVSAFIVITIGSARLFGDWAWLIAGILLILAGLRASE